MIFKLKIGRLLRVIEEIDRQEGMDSNGTISGADRIKAGKDLELILLRENQLN